MKTITINDLYINIIEYINRNKNNNNIEYEETINTIKELIKEIEKEYYKIENKKEEEVEI